MVETERTHTIWRLRMAFWINKTSRAQAQALSRQIHRPTHANTRMHARTHTPRTHTAYAGHYTHAHTQI
jgi:hypothetical protein